ncbi:hypothetical protein D3C86_2008630 [compost metagenome]
MAGVNRLVVQPGNELDHVHTVAAGDFFQLRPEEILQPHAGDHAVDPQRPGGAFPEQGIGLDEQFTHLVPPAGPSKACRDPSDSLATL